MNKYNVAKWISVAVGLFLLVTFLSNSQRETVQVVTFRSIRNEVNHFQSSPPSHESQSVPQAAEVKEARHNTIQQESAYNPPQNIQNHVQRVVLASHSAAGRTVRHPILDFVIEQIFDSETEVEEESSEEVFPLVPQNPRTKVSDENTTTFSIDVDTASYSIVRQFIERGVIPPKDSVRIEEMINYFSYNYQHNESSKVPFSINHEIASCPWDPSLSLLRIGLQGKIIESSPPKNLVFLIDVSGSMGAQNKLPLLKASLTMLVDHLEATDFVSIVVYAGQAGVVLDSTSCDDKTTIYRAINALYASGSTNGGEGLETSYRIAQRHFIEGGINRVVLASDGDFNVGITSRDQLFELISEKRDLGIFLTVLGFGMGNYKDQMMEMLADKGNGNYAYISNLKEATKVLVEGLSGTLIAIAKDVKIQLEFNQEYVLSYRLIGYDNRRLDNSDFTNDKKDAGEMGAGHQVTALYELEMNRSEKNAVEGESLSTIRTRYKNPEEIVSSPFEINVAPSQQFPAGEDFRWSSAVAAFGLLLRDSDVKQNLDYKDVVDLASSAIGDDISGNRREFISLVKKMIEMRSEL